MTETLAEHTGYRQPPVLPDADTPTGDKGHDSDRFRGALAKRGITPCIPARAGRMKPVAYDTELYKRRNLIERMYGRLKDRRRIAIRHDRCAPRPQRRYCSRSGKRWRHAASDIEDGGPDAWVSC